MKKKNLNSFRLRNITSLLSTIHMHAFFFICNRCSYIKKRQKNDIAKYTGLIQATPKSTMNQREHKKQHSLNKSLTTLQN